MHSMPTAATSGAFGNSALTPAVAGPTETTMPDNNITHLHSSDTHRRRRKKPAEPRTVPRDERPLILAERFHTRLCKSFRKSGTCEYGAFCMFAHGKARLRTVDANVRDGLTTTEAIRAWQRALAAEAAAEELKMLPLDTATVGSAVAEGDLVGSPQTACVTSELAAAIGQIGPGPISAESPVRPSVSVVPSTLTTYQHRPYDAVPVSRFPLTP